MTNPLTQLLATRDWLMADGATGTTLFNMGLSSGDAPELWNEDHPDRIAALYKGAVDAGSDIFLTNSFGGTRSRLKLHNAQDRCYSLNKLAAEIGLHHVLGIGFGVFAGFAQDVGDPKAHQLVAPGLGAKLHLLIMGELVFERVFAIFKGRHWPLRAA